MVLHEHNIAHNDNIIWNLAQYIGQQCFFLLFKTNERARTASNDKSLKLALYYRKQNWFRKIEWIVLFVCSVFIIFFSNSLVHTYV